TAAWGQSEIRIPVHLEMPVYLVSLLVAIAAVSTPESYCSGWRERKCSRDASKKAPDIGDLFACRVFSRRRRLVVAGPRRQARPLPGVTGACFERAGNCPHSSQGYERDA